MGGTAGLAGDGAHVWGGVPQEERAAVAIKQGLDRLWQFWVVEDAPGDIQVVEGCWHGVIIR